MSNAINEKTSKEDRLQILASIRNDLVNQLPNLKDDKDSESLKKYCDLAELINSTIRLEQAEKRFWVSQNVAIIGAISTVLVSILSSSGIVLLVQHFIAK